MKKFYRVGNIETKEGLWYSFDGTYTGRIHTDYAWLGASALPMPYDEKAVGYLSCVDVLEDIYAWFNKEEMVKLAEEGIVFAEFESDDYFEYENHWLMRKDAKVVRIIK